MRVAHDQFVGVEFGIGIRPVPIRLCYVNVITAVTQ